MSKSITTQHERALTIVTLHTAWKGQPQKQQGTESWREDSKTGTQSCDGQPANLASHLRIARTWEHSSTASMSSSSRHTESGTPSKTQRPLLISREAFLRLTTWVAGGLCWGLCAKGALRFRFPKLTDPSWNLCWTGTVIVSSYSQQL